MIPKSLSRVRAALGLAILLLASGVPCAAAPAQPVKLVVVVSVDGLSYPRLDRYRPWFQAGFKRLLSEGQVQTGCHYAHLNTETGPGHASLGTGAPPRVHGIVANRWVEAGPDGKLRRLYCTDQPAKAPATGTIPGPDNLRIPTFGDRLVEAVPGARVVSLSGKDRGAIFLAGKDPRHAVYWYDRDTGRYVSSAAYDAESAAGSAVRKIVGSFNQSRAGGQAVGRFGLLWQPLPMPPGADTLPQPEPNIKAYQVPDLGLGFDHDLTGDPRGYFGGIYATPFQDRLLADLALAVLADKTLALGRRGVPDLLALSFSAHDTVSHNYGNESAETLDTLRRLDLELGRLLAALDELAKAEPKGQVVLALSADHGFALLPEVARRQGSRRTGGRLVDSDSAYPNFQERLNRALSEELCLPPDSRPVYAVEGWSLSYDRTAFPMTSVEGSCGPAGRSVTLKDLDEVFPRVVQRMFGEEIQEVLLVSQRDQWPANGPAVSFARNDLDLARSGDAFLVPRENVLMHWDPIRGSGHGSHYAYDTNVPLLFWGGPFRPAERSEASAPYDLAPTLADLLGIRLPEATGTSRLPGRPAGR